MITLTREDIVELHSHICMDFELAEPTRHVKKLLTKVCITQKINKSDLIFEEICANFLVSMLINLPFEKYNFDTALLCLESLLHKNNYEIPVQNNQLKYLCKATEVEPNTMVETLTEYFRYNALPIIS